MSDIHTWIYPWIYQWIYPCISISTATLVIWLRLTPPLYCS